MRSLLAPNVCITAFVAALVAIGCPAHANFVGDRNRVVAPAFAPFYLAKLQAAFASGAFAPSPTPLAKPAFAPDELAFIDAFIATSTRLRLDLARGAPPAPAPPPAPPPAFIRAVSYVFRVERADVRIESARFLDVEDRAPIREKITAYLRNHAPKFDQRALVGKKLGLGFATHDADFELITFDTEETITQFKQGVAVAKTVVRPDVETSERCPAVMRASQIDEITAPDGTKTYAFHADQLEDQALDLTGRHFTEHAFDITNLIPGTIRWGLKDGGYELAYP